ncbi:MAG: hypothetical protein ABSB60_07770 [Terracidiphilus sp.]|jgi:hypothetical protein
MPSPASFAGLLAAFAAPPQRAEAESQPAGWKAGWNSEDGLEDDIATLSYERALRTHARYRIPGQTFNPGGDRGPAGADEASEVATTTVSPKATPSSAGAEPELRETGATPFEQNLKSASITIRMSKVECAQLHRRAADAGLTVSAYLRSCTFEAESLRAMVKETMAELRRAQAQAKSAKPEPARRSWLSGLRQWLAGPWHGRERAARV